MTRHDTGGGRPAAADDGRDREPAGGDFGARVLELVAEIPPGRALSYGDVAALLGSRAARAVGRVMAQSGGTVPWWRVVRSTGLPPRGHGELARPHYEREGTPLVPSPAEEGYRVDLALARWRP